MPNDFNQEIIEEFRANRGRVSGPFEGARLLLLTTTGARSGKPHTTPVGYLPDEGDRLLIIASAGGAPRNPDWYTNLVADPHVTVEDGVFTSKARATVLTGDERDRLFARAVEADPGWAGYQTATSRVIPVVALETIESTPPGVSFGESLRMVHDAFRRELSLVRREVARSGPGLGAQLRVNCLNLCGGLHFHHTMEDASMFPALVEADPELRPVIDRLDQEHKSIAVIIEALQAAMSDADADPQAVLSEIDRLTEELESHLRFEEEQLIPVLDGAAL